MCESSHTINSETPAATHGLNNARTYGMGDSVSTAPTLCMPRLRSEFPKTFVTTTIAVKMRVLRCKALRGEVILEKRLVAGRGCGGGLPFARHKAFALGTERHIF